MKKTRNSRDTTGSGADTAGHTELYFDRPEDLAGWNPAEDLGLPGEYPFTRGIYPLQYRSRLWTMRQYAGFGTARESNQRYRYLLSKGTTGLSVAFDLPTQVGLDSDHPLAQGEVGRVGVAIDSLEDMEALFDGIPLDRVSTSMTINATAPILLALYFAVAERQGADIKSLSGTVQNDILKEYIARGTYIYPPRPAMRLVTDIFAFCRDHAPEWNTISVSGYHIREAGATATQEIAFTLGNGIAYMNAAIERGLRVDDVAPRVSFFLNAHNNFLEEIAKFRAARRMWARIMRERFKARDSRSWMFRFHAQTAGSTLTAQQPDVNIVRVTLQALAAVLGGTQSLHTNARDEALALPTEDSALLALRTQQIIAYESGAANTVDPVAGSYTIEKLTNELEEAAAEYLKKIDAMGGMLAAIDSGFVQREIQQAAYEYQSKIESGKQVIVGVNRYEEGPAQQIPTLRIDPEIERQQIERLRRLRERRDGARVATALKEIDAAARTNRNLMPAIFDAVKVYATVGEISGVLAEVFGHYREAVVI
ncbi:MAG TPA: methylmalonyl-CoA mutase family protein [Terriglobia bacterium]|jgi:methylmalonyl-CoA mutase N-terminal domain/subunit|nr:methylmalonyl-CoA mutase family protein [Terriglobia bacterium]